jgi:hypothetical protein
MRIEAEYFNDCSQFRTALVDVQTGADFFEVSRAVARSDKHFEKLRRFRPADKSAPWVLRPDAAPVENAKQGGKAKRKR